MIEKLLDDRLHARSRFRPNAASTDQTCEESRSIRTGGSNCNVYGVAVKRQTPTKSAPPPCQRFMQKPDGEFAAGPSVRATTESLMRYAIFAAFALALASAAAPAPAEAKGCLKGAMVGGVAGHYAGHHGVMGAIGGCVVGHHLAHEKAKEQAAPPAQGEPAPKPNG
jgi:hypothetical protein